VVATKRDAVSAYRRVGVGRLWPVHRKISFASFALWLNDFAPPVPSSA
jgi:uncharacterized protein YeaO (DUF488 family)